MQQLITKKKLYFYQDDITQFIVPKWPELAVKHHWEQVLKHPTIHKYIPDDWSLSNKQIDRDWFYAIVGTVEKEYLKQLIDNCRNLRDEAKKQKSVIKINDIP